MKMEIIIKKIRKKISKHIPQNSNLCTTIEKLYKNKKIVKSSF